MGAQRGRHVPTRSRPALQRVVDAVDGKVVDVGDHCQIPSVDVDGGHYALAQWLGASVLGQNHPVPRPCTVTPPNAPRPPTRRRGRGPARAWRRVRSPCEAGRRVGGDGRRLPHPPRHWPQCAHARHRTRHGPAVGCPTASTPPATARGSTSSESAVVTRSPSTSRPAPTGSCNRSFDSVARPATRTVSRHSRSACRPAHPSATRSRPSRQDWRYQGYRMVETWASTPSSGRGT
jgi:hypothetical protein